jgi:hypothetical protein
VQERTVPRHDVFSFTALGREYIDHEWLFQVLQYGTYSVGGPAAIAILKCLIISATLVLVALYAVKRGVSSAAALGLVLLAIAGGVTRMIERPELFSTLFAVLTYVLLDRGDRRSLMLLPALSVVWANIHAAVIVGFVIQACFCVEAVFSAPGKPGGLKLASTQRLLVLAASVVASLINPFGLRVLTVPFELTRIINSGVINNEEWRPPTLVKAPFYFVALLVTVLLMWKGTRRVAPILVALFLAFISLRYIRNVGLFCAFTPLLVIPGAASLRRGANVLLGAGLAAFLVVATVYYPFERGVGEASYFPDRIARFVVDHNLRGRMLNSYGLGGYLIWRLFPERLVFIDGRNEVFLPLLHRLKAARDDNRAWNGLLGEHAIEYAVLQYVDDLDKVVTMSRDGRATVSYAPVTATRFPRSRWALVYWDDDGMLFVRRGGVNAALAGREYASIYPEGRGYQRQMIDSGSVTRSGAIAELQRKLAEDPSCRRARSLLSSIRNERGSRP